MMHLGISNRHRHRSRHQKISAALRVSESSAQRYRPVADAAYLDQLSRRMATALGLPLALAARRVREVAVSAGGSLDPGGDARWWKAPRSKP